MSDNLLLTAICPHPPIIVQEVGRDETQKVTSSIKAMEYLSDKIVEFSPDTIVLITPHSIFSHYQFSVYTDESLKGSFRNFGASQVELKFRNDIDLVSSIETKLNQVGHSFYKIPPKTELDHGTLVPMYFINKAGYKGNLVSINYCALGKKDHIAFGELIKQSMEESGKKYIFIASGDLSHRLTKQAPAGYNPNAQAFDKELVSFIEKGDYAGLIEMDDILRENAGECGYNSIMTALGLIDKTPKNNKVFSYEGPFGVGYLVATL